MHLATVGAIYFQRHFPGRAQTLHIRLNAGRCLLIGFRANEKKWGHSAALWRSSRIRSVQNCTLGRNLYQPRLFCRRNGRPPSPVPKKSNEGRRKEPRYGPPSVAGFSCEARRRQRAASHGWLWSDKRPTRNGTQHPQWRAEYGFSMSAPVATPEARSDDLGVHNERKAERSQGMVRLPLRNDRPPYPPWHSKSKGGLWKPRASAVAGFSFGAYERRQRRFTLHGSV
jgi:hypothetical protein